jgi:hypothetical protein
MGAVVRNLCKVPAVLNTNTDFADSSLATGNTGGTGKWNWGNGVWSVQSPVIWTGLTLVDSMLAVGESYVVDVLVDSINGSLTIQPSGEFTKKIIATTTGWHRAIFKDMTSNRRVLFIANNGLTEVSVSACKVYKLGVGGALALVANYGNSAMRGNADRLSVGYQNAVVEKNAFGVPTGLTKDGEFEFDGKSYVDLLSKEVTGDWYLDVFMDAQRASNGRFMYCEILNGVGSVRSSFFLFNEGTQQQIRLFTDTTIGNAGKGNTGFGRGIVTIERVGGDVLLYANGVLKNTIPTVFATIRFRFVSKTGGTTYSDFDSGSLSIETGTRTDAQRATTVPKLMLKHGVT